MGIYQKKSGYTAKKVKKKNKKKLNEIKLNNLNLKEKRDHDQEELTKYFNICQ